MFEWLKKHIHQHKKIETLISSGRLKKYLHSPYLWILNRESVARGVAVGLFVGIIPVLPFQTLLTICIAILIRANLPVAFLASWISNPLTIFPIAYLTYCIGIWVLGEPNQTTVFSKDFSWTMGGMHEAWQSFGVPFFVGLPLLSIGTALLGYVAVILIGYGSDFIKKTKGRRK